MEAVIWDASVLDIEVIEDLESLLVETHGPDCKLDRLICNPTQAIFFCETARRHLGLGRDAGDFDILWGMMRERKSPRQKPSASPSLK